MDTFGERLRFAMAAAAVDARQLSERLRMAGIRGIYARTITRWMTLEEADLSAKLACKTARVLKVGVAWFIDGYGTVSFTAERQEVLALLDRMSSGATARWIAIGREMVDDE